MRKLRALAPALLGITLLAGCHAQARVAAVSCTVAFSPGAALAAELAHGRAPETAPMGKCVASAAAHGNIAAAMLLADIYRRAMASGSPAPLGLDLFGRHIGWLHLAADHGDPAAQLLLAQETDGPASIAMPDATLTWYQTAAENGNAAALAAIGSAYRHGRISDERLYDFKRWLAAQGSANGHR